MYSVEECMCMDLPIKLNSISVSGELQVVEV